MTVPNDSTDMQPRARWSNLAGHSVDLDRTVLVAARLLYGITILGFGVLALAFVDSVHQLQPMDLFLQKSTAHDILSILTGVLLVLAGLAIVSRRQVQFFAVTLSLLFVLWIVSLQVPSAFLFPRLLRSPWWVRTFETVALTGGALVLAGLTRESGRERWLSAGRILFGVSLPVFGVLHLVYSDNVASLVPDFYPWPLFWAYLTGTANIVAGIAIASGRLARPAALLTGAMYATYALTLHIPRAISVHLPLLGGDAAAVQSARAGLTSMFVAIGMWGAGWIVGSSIRKKSAALLAILVMSSAAPHRLDSQVVAAPPSLQEGQRDFDFEFGTWSVKLSRLLSPLTGSNEWATYEGISTVKKVWGGNANLGEIEVSGPAGRIRGMSLRLYNPETRQWYIRWSSARDGMLGPPMIGGFVNGRGEFYNQEIFNGRAILVRFIFSEIARDFFKLEQAFSADGGVTWEANWLAFFERSGS